MRKTYEERALQNELTELLDSVGPVEGRITSIGTGYDLADRCVTLSVTLEHATGKDEDLLIGTMASLASDLFDTPIEKMASRLDQNPETRLTLLSISFKHSDTFTVIPRGTYFRDPAPYNVKTQCPVCLRVHKTRRCGTIVRHGWRVSWGFHQGHCPGWGQRPLEQTDEDALAYLPDLDRTIERLRGEVATHEKGLDQYYFSMESQITVKGYNGPPPGSPKYQWAGKWISPGGSTPAQPEKDTLDWWAKQYGADDWHEKAVKVRWTNSRQPAVELWWSVKRGDETREIPKRPDAYSHTHPITVNVWGKVPSYESLRKECLKQWKWRLMKAEEQKRKILAAIEHHKNNPTTWEGAT